MIKIVKQKLTLEKPAMLNRINKKLKFITNSDRFPVIFYSAISILVLWHLLLPGYILTLDMVFTPSASNLRVENLFYGLDFSLYLNPPLPLLFFLEKISNVVPLWFMQKVLLFLILFLSGFSAHRLCPASSIGKYFAGLLYMLNPFVYVRFMVGQWLLLLAYATLPLSIEAIFNLFKEPNPKHAVKTALFLTCTIMFSVHMSLLLLIIIFIIFFINIRKKMIIYGKNGKTNKLLLISPAISFILLICLNAYWVFLTLTEPTQLDVITIKDLSLFTTKNWGTNFNNILLTIITLHGFWRSPEGYKYIFDILPFWPLFLFLILFFSIYGFLSNYKSEKELHTLEFSIMAVIGLIFACSVSNQYTSNIFVFAFNTIPFFKGFRDSHKFVILLVLAYSYLGGLGITKFWEDSKIKKQAISYLIIGLVLISPVAYASNMLFGFNGQLSNVNYPPEGFEVNKFVRSQKGDFNVLFFPWHWYMKFSWTERIIMNPASHFFESKIIQSEDPEIGLTDIRMLKPTQRYIRFLLDHKDNIINFGELVAPLNVKYIILAKEVDYKEYDFLYNQQDLKVVLDNPKIVVFENQYKTAKIYWVKDIKYIVNWESLLKQSQGKNPLTSVYIVGQNKNLNSEDNSSEFKSLNYIQHSPIEFEIEVPFEDGYVVFAEPYNESWRLNGEKPIPNIGLTNAFYVEKPGIYKLYFQKFNTLLAYYLISLTAFLACITYLIRDKIKPAKRNRNSCLRIM